MSRVTGTEATSACQDGHIFSGLKEEIDVAVHGAQSIWDTKLTTEDWGFLLVDEKNASSSSS